MTATVSKPIDIERCLTGLRSILRKNITESMVRGDRKLNLKVDIKRGTIEGMEVSSNRFTLDLKNGTVAQLNNLAPPDEEEVDRNTDRVKGALRRSLKQVLAHYDQHSIATLSLTLHKGTLKELDQRITSTYA